MQSLLNMASNLVLLIYLSIPWLEQNLKKLYLPIALVLYTGITVFSNLFFFLEPDADISSIISRSWTLVPILLVPLVIIAWQYRFAYVLLFTVLTNAIELVILVFMVKEINFQTLPVISLPIIRAFAFGTVGYIVEQLMTTQRHQKNKLIKANIQLGQYASTLDSLATSRERNRLARELHDTLAHTLSGVAVNLEAVKTIVDPSQTDVLTLLDHSLSATRRGLEETRRALQNLRAQPLEDLGLPLAIESLVKTFSEREGIDTEVEINHEIPVLPPQIEQCIYRITQEALVNIEQHANASHVAVVLDNVKNKIFLKVADDGRGVDLKAIQKENHFGIKGMRERAAVVGGLLSVTSKAEKGTIVQFEWEKPDDQGSNM
jgi:signal transduction histidine kinase